MRKILISFAVILCCTIMVSAQEARNQRYYIAMSNFKYVHSGKTMSTGETVNKIIAGVATGKTSEQLIQYE